MSLFREQEVKSEGQVSTNFKEVRLVPVDDRWNKVDVKNDWFNHIEYQKTKEQYLRTIRPPQISQSEVRHQEVIDLDNPNQQQQRGSSSTNNQQPQRQSLIQRQKPSLRKKLEILKFQHNTLFNQDIRTFLPDPAKLLQSARLITKNNQNLLLLSRSFDPYSRASIREPLQKTLLLAYDTEEIDSKIKACSHYSGLNENTFFKSKGSLDFAQISSSVQFIEKSTLNLDAFFALLVNNTTRISEIAEYLIYNLVVLKQEDTQYPCLYQISLENEKFDFTFGPRLSQVKDLDPTFVNQVLKVNDEPFPVQKNKLLTLDQIKKIQSVIKMETQFGLMLYYGGTQLDYCNQIFQEYEYRCHLLQHILLGLKTIQQKGSIIIELKESFSNFTVSLLFILSRAFQNCTLTKPILQSPLTSDQILICTDLKNAIIPEMEYLENLFIQMSNKMNQKDLELDHLIDPNLLDQEHKFAEYIKNINESIAIYRQEFLKQAIEGLVASELSVNAVKNECLKQWNLFEGDQGKISNRNTEDEFLNMQLPADIGFRGAGSKSSWNPHHTQRPHDHRGFKNQNKPDPDVPLPSEEELARQIRAQDKASEELFQGMQRQKQRQRQQDEEQRKKQQLESHKRQKEQEEQQRQLEIEKLKEKLKEKEKKPAAKKKAANKQEEQQQTSQNPQQQALIQGQKISIPFNNNSLQSKQQEEDKNDFQKHDQRKSNYDDQRKRDIKAHEKNDRYIDRNKHRGEETRQEGTIGSSMSTINIRKNSDLDREQDYHNKDSRRQANEDQLGKRPRDITSQKDRDQNQRHDGHPRKLDDRGQKQRRQEDVEMLTDEQIEARKRKVQEQIEQNKKKLEQEKQEKFQDPSFLEKLKRFKANQQ